MTKVTDSGDAVLAAISPDGKYLLTMMRENGLGKAMIWRRLGRSLDQLADFDAAAPALPGFEPVTAFAL